MPLGRADMVKAPIAGDILEELSPVASRPPIGGSRHIVFLLDASASMNEVEIIDGTSVRRITLLGRAVEEAVQYLGTADRVTAITFNREARLIADEHGGAAGAALLRRQLSAVEPMGETAPDSALGTVAAAVGQTPGAVVVLITDGEIPSMDVPMWKALFERASVSKFVIIAPSSVHSGAAAAMPSTLELPCRGSAARDLDESREPRRMARDSAPVGRCGSARQSAYRAATELAAG